MHTTVHTGPGLALKASLAMHLSRLFCATYTSYSSQQLLLIPPNATFLSTAPKSHFALALFICTIF